MIEISIAQLITLGLLWILSMLMAFYSAIREADKILDEYRDALDSWRESIELNQELRSRYKELIEDYKKLIQISEN